MTPIIDTQSFAAATRADRAILLLDARWSMPSRRAAATVEAWEQDRLRRAAHPRVPIFVARADDQYPPAVLAWLTGQGLAAHSSTGWGEVFWLERGRVVEQLLFKPTADELTRRTLERWGAHLV